MPAGLEVYDAYGNPRVTISDRIGRWLFTLIIPPGATGSTSHPGLLQGQAIPFSTMYLNDSSYSWPGDALYAPQFSFVGDAVSWIGGAATHRTEIWVF